jgi:hypothetical protein
VKVDPEAFGLFVERCLEEGVPASVVARIFELDLELVRQCLSIVRQKRYGTDDLAEYTVQAQWEALEEVRNIMTTGNPTERARVAATLLRTTVAVAGRRVPEKQREMAEKVFDLFKGMRDAPATESEESRFVVSASPQSLARVGATLDQAEDGEPDPSFEE